MVRKFFALPIVWIFLLGILFRFYDLSILPSGLHVDEVKVGWNAYSLFKTGRDDWWHAFPLHYDTFGDQRPTGLFYASVPSLALNGLTVFAIRFTPALFGSLAVIAIFYITKKLTGSNKVAICTSLMLAISPWHITLSRATSEGIVATTLILFAWLYQLKNIESGSRSHFLTSATLYAVSYFFYHTSRLLIPAFIFATTAYYFFNSVPKKINLASIFLFILASALTVILSLSPAARGRLSQVSIFADQGIRTELDRLPFEEGHNRVFLARALHNKVVIFSTRFFNEYTQYFSGKFFLTAEEAKPSRYQTATRGILLYVEFVLLVVGLVGLAQKKFSYLPLLLLLLAPLPAAITTEDAPNLHRSLVMSPFISLIAGFGLYQLSRFSRKILILTVFILAVDLFLFSHLYMVHNPARDSLTLPRNVGAVELIVSVQKYSQKYSRIYLTNRPDHLYPWYVFQTGQDPKIFNPQLSAKKSQDWTYGNIIFSQYRCPSGFIQDQKLKNVLAVDAEGCPPPARLKLVENITRPSGGITYSIWEPKD